MSRVDYHGTGAGLGRIDKTGDANSATDYMLTCGCGLALGPLGGYRANAEGQRSVCCPRCEMVTILDKSAQVIRFLPMRLIVEAQTNTTRGAGT